MPLRTYIFGRASNPAQFELLVDDDEPTGLFEQGQRVSIEPTALKLLFVLIRRKGTYSKERLVSLIQGADTNVVAGDFASHHARSVRRALRDHEPFELIRNDRSIGY